LIFLWLAKILVSNNLWKKTSVVETWWKLHEPSIVENFTSIRESEKFQKFKILLQFELWTYNHNQPKYNDFKFGFDHDVQHYNMYL